MTKSKIKLKVLEAYQDDVKMGVVRIDNRFMLELGIETGDSILIRGGRETVATVKRSYPSDIGRDIIRMDGITRKNAKIGVDNFVEIEKIDVVEAVKISLVPLQESNTHPLYMETVFNNIKNKPFLTGDIIASYSRANSTSRGVAASNPLDIFELALGSKQNSGLTKANNCKFQVKSPKPQTKNKALYVGENTKIEFLTKESNDAENQNAINYEDIGGLKEQLTNIRELVDLPLKYPEIFEKLNIKAPRGILLYGPPGTGKTLLAKAISNETQANFFQISAPEVINKYVGESEKRLRDLFEKAAKSSPAVIFIDEIDAIASKRDKTEHETEKRVVTQLLTLMDGLNTNGKIIVIAATNRPEVLDDALRRAGRFDREIEIGVPKKEERAEILRIHIRNIPIKFPDLIELKNDDILSIIKKEDLPDDFNYQEFKRDLKKDKQKTYKTLPAKIKKQIKLENFIEEIAKSTNGFVGSDISALVKEAAFNLLRRKFPDLLKNESKKEILREEIDKLILTIADFKEALKNIRPSALREFNFEIPKVDIDEVGGLSYVKQSLIEMIEWPFIYPESFKKLSIKSPKGILLYGPPGTGKTLLAKAVATKSKCNFIYIKSPDLLEKYSGDTEKKIKNIFKKARQNSPSIVFFDEIDAIAQSRTGGDRNKHLDTVVNQLLTEVDGLEELVDVKILAATNRPNIIDRALLRPGRFDKLVNIGVPNKEAREKIFEIHTKNSPIKNKDKLISELVDKTEGFVGADIEALVREAGLIALRRDIHSDEIIYDDFILALDIIRPSVTDDLLKYYENIEYELKSPKKDNNEYSMSSFL